MSINPITGREELPQNRESSVGQSRQIDSVARVFQYQYDYAKEGGAVATIKLRGPKLPTGAIVRGGFYKVRTAPTSGGSATIAITSGEAANDIVTETAFDNAIFDASTAGGNKAIVPDHATVADYKIMTAERQPSIVVGTAALTAGKFDLYLDVILPN